MDEWAIIETHPNYAVSEQGQIRNLNTGKLLKHQKSKRGGFYPFVNLYRNGQRKNQTVHSIVARAFLGERPKGFHIHHRDADITNTSVLNLEYVTPQINLSLRRKLTRQRSR